MSYADQVKRFASISPYIIYNYFKQMIRSKSGVSKWCTISPGPLSGIKLWVNTKRDDAFSQMVGGTYDEFIYHNKVILKSKGKVIWDIGAHIGYHTLGFAKMVGDKGVVLAFEPNQANQRRLKTNISGNKEYKDQIHLMPFALGSKIGKCEFITTDDVDTARSSGGYLANISPPLEQEVYREFSKEIVQVKTIDSIINSHKDWTPDILKIDVEGSEAEVLRGGIKLLQKKRPTLFIEVHNVEAMKDVMEILVPLKYHVKLVNRQELTTSRAFVVCTYKIS